MSRIRKWSDEDLICAVESSTNMRQVLSKLNLAVAGGSYVLISNHMKRLNLSFDLSPRERMLAGIEGHKYNKRYSDSEVFCRKSQASITTIKKRFIEVKNCYECSVCGLNSWNGELLSLHMDHINGDRTDNRFENLRLLCPNCHSLTETYGGKNKLLR